MARDYEATEEVFSSWISNQSIYKKMILSEGAKTMATGYYAPGDEHYWDTTILYDEDNSFLTRDGHTWWSKPNVTRNENGYEITATFTEIIEGDWDYEDIEDTHATAYDAGTVILRYQGKNQTSTSLKLSAVDWLTESWDEYEFEYPVLSGTVSLTLPADCAKGIWEIVWWQYVGPDDGGPYYQSIRREFVIE